jgi:hypothetical protein
LTVTLLVFAIGLLTAPPARPDESIVCNFRFPI